MKMEKPARTPYSKDGYIIDQAKLTGIRYGVFTSDVNGCGWIAAYNFLKRMGLNVNEKAIADELIRRTVFRGLVGTDLFRLRRFLKKRGYRMPLKLRWNKKARLPEGTSAGIIWYCHKDGFHFVSFYADKSISPEEDGEARFRFLNGLAGHESHLDTMTGFLTKSNILPFALIMIWPGREAQKQNV